jgi:hypothetical protein
MLSEIQNFCKRNSIECTWDFSKRDKTEWSEVLYNGELVLQVDSNCTEKQFLELCNYLNDDFTNGGDKVSGNDFWFVTSDEKTFKDFYLHYKNVFIDA